MQTARLASASFLFLLWAPFSTAQTAPGKALLTLDEFFNTVEIIGVRIAPDGHADPSGPSTGISPLCARARERR